MKKCVSLIFMFTSTLLNAHEHLPPPELWSWIKELNKSTQDCRLQSSMTLKSMGVEHQIENEYGLYGVYKGNRVVIKCLTHGETSKLMVAVAGYNGRQVEKVRNHILEQID